MKPLKHARITYHAGMDRFNVPNSQQRFELEIKRSRFITTVVPVTSKSDALAAIEAIRTEFPDANHHCWAMVAESPNNVYHQDQSDDGEPKGTAGKPMLNVLLHSDLGNIVVVVTRFFGGVKLGAGGLVRAYTQCVSSALQNLETRTRFILVEHSVVLPYSQLSSLEHWLRSTDIEVRDKKFTDQVTLQLAVPKSALETLTKRILELGGNVTPNKEQAK
ncbi:MAG: YigZ family protein [Granulosicoccus sp.]